MSYNKYNTRNSGRFNTPGQFVPATETGGYGGAAPARTLQNVQYNRPAPPQTNSNQNQANYTTFQVQPPAPPPPAPQENNPPMDIQMKEEPNADGKTTEESTRPPWMKPKLQGIRKISNKERRRRQNENLRRLLTPKSALMVLNEIMPKEQITNQFHFEPVPPQGYGYNYRGGAANNHFCADITLEGHTYKGYGENKMTARNAAAEQAVRDLILRKMSKVLMPEAGENQADGTEPKEGGEGEEEADTLPMIQLASFALHKLFSEWEYEGHKVPHLRTPSVSVSESGEEATPPQPKPPRPPKAKAPRVLPDNAASMHPAMLLAYMRPQLEYRELGADGDRPQNMVFTMGIDVDGTTYMGKASSKKEARKQAARAACTALFGVKFDSV